MSEIKAIFTNPENGGVCIQSFSDCVYVPSLSVDLAPEEFQTFPDGAPDGWRKATSEEIAKRDLGILGISEYFMIDASILAGLDSSFFSAWVQNQGIVSVDMSRAREVQREMLRQLRAPLLAELDVKYQRAQESNDQQAEADVVSKKQALRNVTLDPAIDDAQNTDELKIAGMQTINNGV